MRQLLTLFAFALAATMAIGAPVTCPGFVSGPVATVDSGVSGYSLSCQGLTFNNFQAINAGGVPALTQVHIVTATYDLESGFVNLQFNPSLGASMDMHFYFNVSNRSIDAIDLTNGGHSSTSIYERACSTPIDKQNANICTGGLGNQLAEITALGGAGNTVMGFVGGYAMPGYIYKDLLSPAGGHISSFTQSFHIPEPMTMLLTGVGLLGLGLVRRKLR